MDTAQVILGLMSSGQSRHGYELKTTYDHWFGTTKELAFGQVYATLARFLRDGLIKELGKESGGGPDRKSYAITAQGKQRIQEWMFTPEEPHYELRNNLFAKTVIALMSESDAGQLIDLQRQSHLAKMRTLTQKKLATTELSTVLILDYALFHIEADLRWIEHTAARIEQLRKEIQQ